MINLLWENDSVSPLLGSSKLGKDHACHTGLDDDPHHALDALHDDGLGALLRGLPRAVPDGVLGLHAEQEGRGEVDVGQDAGDELAGLHLGHVLLEVVSVNIGYQPPDDSKYQPRQHETCEKHEKSVAPFEIQNCDENILIKF